MRIHRIALVGLLVPILARPQIDEGRLTLRAQPISRRYCEVDDEIATLLIKFKISLTNAKNPAVDFYSPVYPLLLVSRTMDDLRKGKHEFELHAPDRFVPSLERSETDRPVPPAIRGGETVESEIMEVTLPAPMKSKYSKFEGLDPGTHYVQLVMDLNVEGTSTFARATSQPVEITVDKHPKLEKCK
jgi:hypothetical protein